MFFRDGLVGYYGTVVGWGYTSWENLQQGKFKIVFEHIFIKGLREVGRDSTEAGCSYTDKRGMSGEV